MTILTAGLYCSILFPYLYCNHLTGSYLLMSYNHKTYISREPVRAPEDFLVFGSPAIEQAEIDEVVASLRSGWIGTGPKVAQFENDFKKYKQVDYAAALNSCTAALHLSMRALELQPGDEVITSAMTFCATVNAIISAQGTPVLADIDPQTYNLDPAEIERRITAKTKAILPVHFAGRPCNMDAILSIARRHNLKIIEDCAHAIETSYRGQPAGTFGDFGCFSFYATKNITTGEGGMVIAKRETDINRIKRLALHGMTKDAWRRFQDEGYKHYYVEEAGYKYSMMDMQAAIGIHQLKRIQQYWQRRRTIWSMYNEALCTLPVQIPQDPEPNTCHSLHLYTVLVEEEKVGIDRDAFLTAMQQEGIGTGVHYLSIPEHPFYQRTFGWKPEDFPHAMRVGRQTVSLPISAKLSDKDVHDVCTAAKKIIYQSERSLCRR